MRDCFKRILAAINPATNESYDRKLMAGVLLVMLAFVPALAIAAVWLSALSKEQNDLALMDHEALVLTQGLLMPLQAEDALMPVFVLTADRHILGHLQRRQEEFDAVLARFRGLERRDPRVNAVLDDIAALEAKRRTLAAPGIAMRLRGEPIQNVNEYIAQHRSDVFGDLHRAADRLVRLVNAQSESFVTDQRGRLSNISAVLFAADGFAGIACVGISLMLLRLLQAKRRHDAALARAAEWQRTLAAARKNAVEVVAHDLRHPLQVMMFAAERLQRATTDRQSAQAALEGLARSATAMRRLIDTVLHPANVDAETPPMRKERVDLHGVLRDIVGRFQFIAAAGHVALSLVPGCELQAIEADPTRLEQVVSNLLGNALKFTPAGGSVTLSTAWIDPWVTIEVADTGPGMSAKQVGQIFSRYWRGGESREHGSGLGLAISKAIVDAHGGRIEVDSILGRGSAFTVYLPAVVTSYVDAG